MDSLLVIGLWGIVSVLATEAVTWIDKKISGTVLKGDGAFLLSAAVAFVIAGVKFFLTPGVALSWSTFGADAAQIFAASQLIFIGVYQKLGLDISSTPAVQTPTAQPLA